MGATILLAVFAVTLAGGDRFSFSRNPVRRDVALRINPNTADASELMLLPGIGPRLAEEIIAYRTRAGVTDAFQSAADLDAVRRIGPRSIERLQSWLTFETPHGEENGP